ncbi:SAF domain-containing protein [Brachybacterium rhamnosum]|uniref:SAF domain-containing protein n=1 Tax=Brachybacterium rhamnosum TaxID=173361 RepID=A0ABW4PTH0_9MICO
MLPRIRARLPLWRRALRRRRRLLLLLLAAALTATALPGIAAAVVPPGAHGTEVVVAARDLDPAQPLTSADLSTVRVADQLVPPGAVSDPAALLGSRTSLAIPAGTALQPALMRGGGVTGPGSGEALMVVDAPAALAAHLATGTALEILAPDPESGLARRVPARVIEVTDGSPGGAAIAGAGGAGTVELLVAVGREESDDLAAAQRGGWLTVSVVG